MRLACVIDREDTVATLKFLLCAACWFALYQCGLLAALKRLHFILNSDVERYIALVLTAPHSRFCRRRTNGRR